MPIYCNYGTTKAPYSRVTNLNYKDIMKLSKIIFEAKKSFMYKSDDVFCRSVEINLTSEPNKIATFNFFRTGIDDSAYIQRLEALINEANILLVKNKKYANDYRFDIMGSWTYGEIIIMKK